MILGKRPKIDGDEGNLVISHIVGIRIGVIAHASTQFSCADDTDDGNDE